MNVATSGLHAAVQSVQAASPQRSSFADFLKPPASSGQEGRLLVEPRAQVPAQGGTEAVSLDAVVSAPSSQFRTVTETALNALTSSERKLNLLVHKARSGASFTPSELMRMQLAAYQASQIIDFGGKLAEKATSGVKQVLQTQV